MEKARYAHRPLPGTMLVIREHNPIRKVGVKKLPQSSIFEAGTASIAELFEDYIENYQGNNTCIALSISKQLLDDTSRNAIEKSLAALGYGSDACTYASLTPIGAALDSEASEPRNESFRKTDPHVLDVSLDARALFVLVEGLDPLFVIAADEGATKALREAYRAEYEPDSAIRISGRPSVAFRNLPSLLSTDGGRQLAWHLFKSFPKRP